MKKLIFLTLALVAINSFAELPVLKQNDIPLKTESGFIFGYGNSPYFAAAYDPLPDPSSIPGMGNICYGNFMNENKIEWVNRTTRARFFLYDITDQVWQDGVLVGGTLVWAKYDILIPASK